MDICYAKDERRCHRLTSPAHGTFCDAQAPSAVARFKHLREASYFNRMRFHSAQSGAVAHFGIASDPKLTKFWRKKTFYDESADKEIRSNRRGTISFAGLPGAKHRRSTSMIINFADNLKLDQQAYTPFAYIIWGMNTVDQIYKHTADEALAISSGEEYLSQKFPRLSGINTMKVIQSMHEVLHPTGKPHERAPTIKYGPFSSEL